MPPQVRSLKKKIMAKIETYGTVVNPSLSDKLIGTDVDGSNATKNFTISSILALSDRQVAVPSASTNPGAEGDYAVDDSYFYIFTPSAGWKRVSILTW